MFATYVEVEFREVEIGSDADVSGHSVSLVVDVGDSLLGEEVGDSPLSQGLDGCSVFGAPCFRVVDDQFEVLRLEDPFVEAVLAVWLAEELHSLHEFFLADYPVAAGAPVVLSGVCLSVGLLRLGNSLGRRGPHVVAKVRVAGDVPKAVQKGDGCDGVLRERLERVLADLRMVVGLGDAGEGFGDERLVRPPRGKLSESGGREPADFREAALEKMP